MRTADARYRSTVMGRRMLSSDSPACAVEGKVV